MMTYSLTTWGSKPQKETGKQKNDDNNNNNNNNNSNNNNEKKNTEDQGLRVMYVPHIHITKKMVEQSTSIFRPLGMVMYHEDRLLGSMKPISKGEPSGKLTLIVSKRL